MSSSITYMNHKPSPSSTCYSTVQYSRQWRVVGLILIPPGIAVPVVKATSTSTSTKEGRQQGLSTS